MLVEKMAQWVELKSKISKLEAEIKREVSLIGKIQNDDTLMIQDGNVRASFVKGGSPPVSLEIVE